VIRLRPFHGSDLHDLHKLDQVCFAPDIAYSKAELEYFLANPRSTCWVAEAEDFGLAGFLILERMRRRGIAAGHIVTIDVAEATRRQGVGRLLMETAEAEAKRHGARLLMLEVAEDNTAARAFYRKMGFADVGRIARYYAGRLDARVMEKIL
jgi:[ribosomal protein S18]-alanine N-acetyltransferase